MFRATCLAILLRHKLSEKLPSVTHPATNISGNIFVAEWLQQVEPSSTFRNISCNAATNFFHIA